ncbi:pyrroline-5-carboxylate reductase [Alkalicoccus halolimnae]|uniref:Pyrroline-5-carboxylate reductase n=1 Tax=Alkalicoccus halolimnae TaxID=1667239 RepID=A0A5C7EZU7_9BACI|nr:pyrroline-5-carboxylate reductase [Alkalicoccus halolimnae]TXF81979.1 pyrroline-5-carboxylate reductase [Alkalicoccus halolimnae]
MEKANILFIGAGRMAEAIVSGIAKSDRSYFNTITMANRSNKEKLMHLKDTYGIQMTTDWMKAVQKHDIIVLATPPKTHDELLHMLTPHISGQLVITVAAGIDPQYMEMRLPEETPVCWIMPNTAAQVGMSMSTYTCGQFVESRHRPFIQALLDAIGPAEELTAGQVHDLTAVTGSAPAFIYYTVKALEEAAEAYDISGIQARKLVVQMLKGSVAMLEEGHDPQELMEQVATPGGSTAEGLRVLETYGVDRILKQAVEAVNDHARTNGKESG